MNKDVLKKVFSQILKEKRSEHNYSIAKASELCCISDRAFSNLERANSLPNLETLINLSITFNISLDDYIQKLIQSGYKPTNQIK